MITEFRPMSPRDWDAVRSIYQEGIATRLATFETSVPDWKTWDSAHREDCRIVAEEDHVIVGWAALSPVSHRAVYRGVAEVSVYLTRSAWGRGCGGQLLTALIRSADQAGVWTLQASVFPENAASIRMHERCGFRIVGTRERIGQLDGQWKDVLLMERRAE